MSEPRGAPIEGRLVCVQCRVRAEYHDERDLVDLVKQGWDAAPPTCPMCRPPDMVTRALRKVEGG